MVIRNGTSAASAASAASATHSGQRKLHYTEEKGSATCSPVASYTGFRNGGSRSSFAPSKLSGQSTEALPDSPARSEIRSNGESQDPSPELGDSDLVGAHDGKIFLQFRSKGGNSSLSLESTTEPTVTRTYGFNANDRAANVTSLEEACSDILLEVDGLLVVSPSVVYQILWPGDDVTGVPKEIASIVSRLAPHLEVQDGTYDAARKQG